MLPRGVRNRNPGNIETSTKFTWEGEIRPSRDERFCTFDTPLYGLRAMMKLLMNYQKKHNLNTIKELITRYAPQVENHTLAYYKYIATHANRKPDEKVNTLDAAELIPIVEAMVVYENGQPPSHHEPYWYPSKAYQEAFELAAHGKIVSHSRNRLQNPDEWKRVPTERSFWQKLAGLFKSIFGGKNV